MKFVFESTLEALSFGAYARAAGRPDVSVTGRTVSSDRAFMRVLREWEVKMPDPASQRRHLKAVVRSIIAR